MLCDLKGKQAHPLSYKIRSLSADQAAFELLPANRYYQIIDLYQTTVGISAAEVTRVCNQVVAVYSENKLQHYAIAYRNHKSAGEK